MAPAIGRETIAVLVRYQLHGDVTQDIGNLCALGRQAPTGGDAQSTGSGKPFGIRRFDHRDGAAGKFLLRWRRTRKVPAYRNLPFLVGHDPIDEVDGTALIQGVGLADDLDLLAASL